MLADLILLSGVSQLMGSARIWNQSVIVMLAGVKKKSQKNSKTQKDQSQRSRWKLKRILSLTGRGTTVVSAWSRAQHPVCRGQPQLWLHKPAERFISEKPNSSSVGDNEWPAKWYKYLNPNIFSLMGLLYYHTHTVIKIYSGAISDVWKLFVSISAEISQLLTVHLQKQSILPS